MEKQNFKNYPFDNYIFEGKYILNPLSGRKVNLNGVIGKKVQAAIKKFFPKEKELNNDVMEHIVKFSSPNTQSKLFMTNKHLNKLIGETVNDDVKLRAKQNYNFFIKALHSLKNTPVKDKITRFTMYCIDEKNVFANLECSANIFRGQIVSFDLKLENSKRTFIDYYEFSQLDEFDLFKHIKSKKNLKSFIFTMKHLSRVFIPFDGKLEDEWNKSLQKKK